MKITFATNYIEVQYEPGDPKPKDESHLLHQIKLELNGLGYDVIKKRMWKDGHMVADTQQYIRSRNKKSPHFFAVWDSQYAVRDLAQDYRQNGSVCLDIRRWEPDNTIKTKKA